MKKPYCPAAVQSVAEGGGRTCSNEDKKVQKAGLKRTREFASADANKSKKIKFEVVMEAF